MTGRRTATSSRHRQVIRRGQPPCGICHQPIDYTLPYLDPGEYVVDHIIPLKLGGPDTLANKQAAHRSCNGSKGARMEAGRLYVRRSGSLD